MLFEQPLKGLVYTFLADVLAHRIKREGPSPRKRERVGGPKQGRTRAQTAGHSVGAERLLDYVHRGVGLETFDEQTRSLHVGGRDSQAPPLARDAEGHY